MKLTEQALKRLVVLMFGAYSAVQLADIYRAFAGPYQDPLSGAITIGLLLVSTAIVVSLYRRRWDAEGIQIANMTIVGMWAYVVTTIAVICSLWLLVMMLT